jgi:hypothetical protein
MRKTWNGRAYNPKPPGLYGAILFKTLRLMKNYKDINIPIPAESGTSFTAPLEFGSIGDVV